MNRTEILKCMAHQPMTVRDLAEIFGGDRKTQKSISAICSYATDKKLMSAERIGPQRMRWTITDKGRAEIGLTPTGRRSVRGPTGMDWVRAMGGYQDIHLKIVRRAA